tara:strand:- start:482 stop:1150 length:669 start_codon:yes stop_codon:yes gene_type:complete
MVNKIRNGIVWVRTPKCATSTMAVHLQNFCEWKGMKYVSSNIHNSEPPKNQINLGHLRISDVNWDVINNENRGVMGSIRDPLTRFVSHYKHNRREGWYEKYENNVSSFYLENCDNTHFEDTFRGMDNYLCKYLGVGDDVKWDESLLKERYDYFTVSEDLPKSLSKFEKLTGYTFENKSLIYNSIDSELIQTDEFIKTFKDRNKNDYELYNFILNYYGYETTN